MGSFDTIDHDVLMTILSEKLHDGRFLRLIQHLLQSGYLEDWVYNNTYSGTPQGGVVSPILANIYLDRLDQYVETVLLPRYTAGAKRRRNPEYQAVKFQLRQAEKKGQREAASALRKQMQALPSVDTNDSIYRRLRYVRYADDFLLGFAGPRAEAEEIKRLVGEFLRQTLRLELSSTKTLITHATTEAARFLGYEIVNQQADDKRTDKTRHVNGRIGLRVPQEVVDGQCARYMIAGKPASRLAATVDDDYSIVFRYQQEYRGVVQYYRLAHNAAHLSKLLWVMRGSLLRTLAHKHQTTVAKMARKYSGTVTVEGAKYRCLKIVRQREGKAPLVAQFGGLPLKREPWVTLTDSFPKPTDRGRTEIIKRLLADECELCGSREQIEVHHVRKIADLNGKRKSDKPPWVRVMSERRRKTLVVCHACHVAIHTGRPTRQRTSE